MRKQFRRRDDYHLILNLFTEGEKTEFSYINDYILQVNKKDIIRLSQNKAISDPVLLVKEAICYAKNLNLTKDEVSRSIWVIFDYDNRDDAVNKALRLVNDYNKLNPRNVVNCAFMKPCFELWPLMHFMDSKYPSLQAQIQSKLKEFMPKYHHQRNPIIDVSKLSQEGYLKACKNAKSWKISLDDIDNPNSSSFYAGIFELTELIDKTI